METTRLGDMSRSSWAMLSSPYNSVRKIGLCLLTQRASQVALVAKNPPANAGNIREIGSIPWSGRSPGRGNGNPLLHSCLENFMDRGAWWGMVHGVAKSQTQLKMT